MVVVYPTSTTPFVAEHMTIGKKGWVSAVKPRPSFSCVTSNRSHPVPLHSISSPLHFSHIRQAILSCDTIKFTLESGYFAAPFSILREASVESFDNGIPRIATLD